MHDWLNEKSVIYQIFIDRFAGYEKDCDPSKPEWCGGNIRGVIDKLDYLEELGINAIYLTPFLKSGAYHGYETQDFFEVDTHFGKTEDIKELTRKAKEKNMRVIMDFVANHISNSHPIFLEAASNPKSEYREWFHFKKWPHSYESFLDFKDLPKLNLQNPDAKKHVIEAAKHWINNHGIDGLRLDHVVGQPLEFWEEFYKEIKHERAEVKLIAEAGYFFIKMKHLRTLRYPKALDTFLNALFKRSEGYLDLYHYYHEVFDGFLDFNFRHEIERFAHGKSNLDKIRKRLDRFYKRLPQDGNTSYLTFLDNHDKSRYLYEADGDINSLMRAAELQASIPQPMIIYYGTEVGLTHHIPSIANTHRAADTPSRGLMQWDNLSQQQIELLDFYKNLIKNR